MAMYRFDALFCQLSGMAAQIQQFAAMTQDNDVRHAFAIGKQRKDEEHVCNPV